MKYTIKQSMTFVAPKFSSGDLDPEASLQSSARSARLAFSTTNRCTKRCLDVFLSVSMIVLFAPIIAILSVYILTVYRISPIYCHSRIGLNGKRFNCYKFCTMVPDADAHLARILASDPVRRKEWGQTHKLKDDPRILPGVGSLLRKSSLDELPQIFNVLFGQMSMVGPRPVTKDELFYYGDYLQHYLSVRPGITGAWQIGGRSDTSYDDRVSIDVWYVENATVLLDFHIFLKTVSSFCSGRLSGGA